MKVAELIEKLKLLPQELEVVTEGDECLYLNDPNPRIQYYLPEHLGADANTPTYNNNVERFYIEGAWVEKILTPVIII